MLPLYLIRSFLFGSSGGLGTISSTAPTLNVTAISARDGVSILECWQIGVLQASSQKGVVGSSALFLGEVDNATYTMIPPGYEGTLHNAPSPQFVFVLSGLAHVTLPSSTGEAWIHGGRSGFIIAVDTAAVSTHGHLTSFPGPDYTIMIQIPFRGSSALSSVTLHAGACNEAEMA
jgi:hypothetical protein